MTALAGAVAMLGGLSDAVLVAVLSFIVGPTVVLVLTWIRDQPGARATRERELRSIIHEGMAPVREDVADLSRRLERVEGLLMGPKRR